MRIAHAPTQVERQPRAVAIGTFDGVHVGHRAIVLGVIDTGLAPTVITFDPHPRIALGNQVELVSTLERRLELLAETGVETTLVAAFTPELMRLEPEEFAQTYLRAIGVEVVIAGEDFRFGRRRAGDLTLLRELGFEVVTVDAVPDASSTAVRTAVREGRMDVAARLLGRPFELDGVVVPGDRRGGDLGYPTANIALHAQLLCPGHGVYAGFAHGHRAALSIGTNPHYGGTERRIEPFLLDFEGDLYGQRLVVEVWAKLRDQAVFGSDQALIDQITRDVEATRSAVRPV